MLRVGSGPTDMLPGNYVSSLRGGSFAKMPAHLLPRKSSQTGRHEIQLLTSAHSQSPSLSYLPQ